MSHRELAGSAQLELVSGVAQLRPEDAMFEAMLHGWRAQQVARGLRLHTIECRERLVRRFLEASNDYPWNWGPGHVEEWALSLVSERHLSASTVRGYQVDLRLFSEYLTDPRYGWGEACEEAFGAGVHPVPVCHEWNTVAHLNGYEGSPEARPFTREELQRFLDYADDQVERRRVPNARGLWRPTGTPRSSRSCTAGGSGGPRPPSSTSRTGGGTLLRPSSAATAP